MEAAWTRDRDFHTVVRARGENQRAFETTAVPLITSPTIDSTPSRRLDRITCFRFIDA